MAMVSQKKEGAPQAAAPKECARLNAAYAAMKAGPDEKHYIAMLEALEADLKDNAIAYVPVQTKEDVEALQKKGTIKWLGLESPKGRVLALFTTHEQALRKGALGNAGINLGAFFKILLDNKELVGFAVNPFDEGNGYLIDRKNLEVVVQRAQSASVPRLGQDFVEPVWKKLFDVAVGVPEKVTAFADELAAVGGPAGILQPVLDKWQNAIKAGTYKPTTPDDYVKTIVKDAMTSAFVAGVLSKQGLETVRKADPAQCLERVPYLKDDLVQNTDEYLIELATRLRKAFGFRDDGHVWVTLANSVGVVSYGAMCFGFGWGLAKLRESEGK